MYVFPVGSCVLHVVLFDVIGVLFKVKSIQDLDDIKLQIFNLDTLHIHFINLEKCNTYPQVK